MSKKETSIVELNIKSIVPDDIQPRKNFNPERLSELMGSIKKYGIINPIVVEEMDNGKYLLWDGERRFRAATELKLDTVPAIIRPKASRTDRLIQQFHIQEQHEGWTSMEKAIAVSELSEALGIGLKDLAKTLDLPQRTIGDYVSFSQLLERKEFIKSEAPVNFASGIVSLRNFVKKQYMDVLETEFTEAQQSKLEKALISRIKSGGIKITRDIVKIRDSVKAEPKSIMKFMSDDSMTVEHMFLKTEAKVAHAYRNILAANNSLLAYTGTGKRLGVEKLFSESEKKDLARGRDAVGELIGKI